MASIEINSESPQANTSTDPGGNPFLPRDRRPAVRFWRSPQGQPAWARPVLLGIAAAAALVYSWGMGQLGVHEYYAPAVRAMSESWKAFFYNGYDVHSSVTMDKLSGAFMLQALSVRLLGWHAWAMLLPQLLAEVGSVLLLYRVVRRWQGPAAGLLAAGLLAATPMFAAVARSQVSDGLLVLLLVAAAAFAQTAWTTGRLGPLVLCGVLVGLAFQTKMVQAWAVLPGFAVAYLLAAPPRLPVRLRRLLIAGTAMLAVSLWQVALFALTPVSARPYVDGTSDNSLSVMIFGYNLLNRFGLAPVAAVGAPVAGQARSSSSSYFGYLISQPAAPQVGWLYPLAGFGLVLGLAGLRARRRQTGGKPDGAGAGYLMWGLWFLVHAIGFTTGYVIHSFYLVVLAPAVAALAAAGVVELARRYRQGRSRRLIRAALLVQGAWSIAVCSMFVYFQPWVLPVTAVLLLAGLVLLVRRRRPQLGAVLAGLGVLAAPLVWSVLTIDPEYAGAAVQPWAGPSGGGPGGQLVRCCSTASGPPGADPQQDGGEPVQSITTTTPSEQTRRLIGYLQSRRTGQKYLVAAAESTGAQSLLMTGAEVLPMGGFSGEVPFPTTQALAGLIADGAVRFVIVDSPQLRGGPDKPARLSTDGWVQEHCTAVPAQLYGGGVIGTLYDCRAAG